jgi:hypothetical protein
VTADPGRPPFYARLLRLRHIRPGVVSCFLFLEGTLVLSGLLALAGLVSPWVVLVLPVSVALAVKINDVVAGATARSKAVARPAAGTARPGPEWSRSHVTSRDLLLDKMAAEKLTSKDLER